MHYLILLIFLKLFIINNSSCWRLGGEKKWLPDLEFSTKDNWINNELPLKNSRIRFPLAMKHSVGLPLIGDMFFGGIELPHDGSLLLPLNGKIQFDNAKENKMRENNTKIFEWKLSGSFSWMDPDNWSGSNNATPHLERIPCSTDMVLLPNSNRSLSMKLPNFDVNVKEVKIANGSLLEEWDWQDVMKGREFRNSRWSVKYSGLQYCDSDDCLCRLSGDADELLEEVCKIEYPKCSKDNALCEYPLKVEGHCCSYCGGRITLKRTVSLSTLNELTMETLKIYGDTVSYHARMTFAGNVEVLVTENGAYTGINSQEAIHILEKIFSEKGLTILSYVTTGASLTGSVLGPILGPMFIIPLVIILIIFVGIPYSGYSWRDIQSLFRECSSIRDGTRPNPDSTQAGDFRFARFENISEGDVQLARPVMADDDDDDADSDNDGEHHDGKRFENPLYRSKRQEQTQRIIDINKPVSLADLQGKINTAEGTNIDSD